MVNSGHLRGINSAFCVLEPTSKGDENPEQNNISTEWSVSQHVENIGHVACGRLRQQCPLITSQLSSNSKDRIFPILL